MRLSAKRIAGNQTLGKSNNHWLSGQHHTEHSAVYLHLPFSGQSFSDEGMHILSKRNTEQHCFYFVGFIKKLIKYGPVIFPVQYKSYLLCEHMYLLPKCINKCSISECVTESGCYDFFFLNSHFKHQHYFTLQMFFPLHEWGFPLENGPSSSADYLVSSSCGVCVHMCVAYCECVYAYVCECLSDFKTRRATTSCQVYISFCTWRVAQRCWHPNKHTHSHTPVY